MLCERKKTSGISSSLESVKAALREVNTINQLLLHSHYCISNRHGYWNCSSACSDLTHISFSIVLILSPLMSPGLWIGRTMFPNPWHHIESTLNPFNFIPSSPCNRSLPIWPFRTSLSQLSSRKRYGTFQISIFGEKDPKTDPKQPPSMLSHPYTL